MKKATALAIVTMFAAAACAGLSPQYRLGVQAEMARSWEEAIASYERASLDHPKEPVYRLALERVRIKASLFHLQEARALLASGKKDEAASSYDKALEYNPRDASIAYEARLALSGGPKEAEPRSTKIEFPIKLEAREGKLELRLPTETSIRAVFQTLGRAGGINVIFDETFRGEAPFATDLSDVTFEQALGTLCKATRNFYRIIDERTVVVVPDTPVKRIQYEVNVIRTFYLSNANAQEMQASLTNVLRGTAKIPIIYPDKSLNSLTIRDTPQVVEMAEKLIRLWDKPKAEVIIDVEIMEVSRIKLRQLGISFDQNILGLRYGGVPADATSSATSGWFGLTGMGLSKAENYAVSLPLAFLQFLESDTDTKIVAQPRFRAVADEEFHQLVGQKVPVPSTTFQPFAAGGFGQQPITQYDYKDVGIDVKLTPKVHTEGEVSMALELKVTSIGGKGYADLPIINTRELKGVLRLKDGETNLIAGLLRDEERKSFKGIPGLKDLPGIGRLFGAEDTTLEQTDIIMTITPHIIRSIPITAEDLKPLWVDLAEAASDAAGAGMLDLGFQDPEITPVGNLAALARRSGGMGGNSVLINPPSLEIPAGREFRMSINVRNEAELGTMSLALQFNPGLLTLKTVTEGGLGRSLGENVPFLHNVDNNSGICTIGFSTPQIGRGVQGGGILATLVFESKTAGEAVVAITNLSAAGPTGQGLTFETGEARVRIR